MCLGQYSNKCCTMGIDPLIGKTGSHRTAVHIHNVHYPTDIHLEWVKCTAQLFTSHMLTYSKTTSHSVVNNKYTYKYICIYNE